MNSCFNFHSLYTKPKHKTDSAAPIQIEAKLISNSHQNNLFLINNFKRTFSNNNNLRLITNKEINNNILSKNNNKRINKSNDFSISLAEVSFTQEIKKLKTFIELILSKDCEKDLDILDLKRYFYLRLKTNDYIDKNITDSAEIKEKITKVIQANKDLDKANELTKYLLFNIENEKNDYFFKCLLLNALLNIKIEDKETESFYFLKDIRYNLLSVSPKIFLKSKFLLKKLQSILKNLIKNKNYLAVEVIDLVILCNILKSIYIDIEEEEDFLRYLAERVFKHEIKAHFDMLFTIDNIENKPDYLFNVFEYFQFFMNYKDKSLLSSLANKADQAQTENAAFLLSFSLKVEIKKAFRILFKAFLENDSELC